MAEEPEDQLPPEGGGTEELAPEAAGAAEGGEPEAPASGATSDVEDLARDMGWSPKEQWRGDPDQWKDAKTFLRTTVEINRTQSRELRAVKQTLDRVSRTTATIAERHIQEERERLQNQLYDATANNDPAGAYEASTALQRINAQPEPQGDDPLADFRERNAWYGADAEATAYAHSLGEMNKGKPPEEQIRLVEEAVRKRFPEHFAGDKPQQRQQGRAPLVSSTPSRASRPAPRDKTAADLPTEARKAGEDFVRRGRISSLAEYAKIYFEENA